MKKGIVAAFAVACVAVTTVSCSKEPRKVDINDGKENPIDRKLIVEVTDRYIYQSSVLDSVLPDVEVTLFESVADTPMDNYYRRAFTGTDGKATFQQIKADTFVVILKHPTMGRKQEQVRNTVNTVVSYEYFYF